MTKKVKPAVSLKKIFTITSKAGMFPLKQVIEVLEMKISDIYKIAKLGLCFESVCFKLKSVSKVLSPRL